MAMKRKAKIEVGLDFKRKIDSLDNFLNELLKPKLRKGRKVSKADITSIIGEFKL